MKIFARHRPGADASGEFVLSATGEAWQYDDPREHAAALAMLYEAGVGGIGLAEIADWIERRADREGLDGVRVAIEGYNKLVQMLQAGRWGDAFQLALNFRMLIDQHELVDHRQGRRKRSKVASRNARNMRGEIKLTEAQQRRAVARWRAVCVERGTKYGAMPIVASEYRISVEQLRGLIRKFSS